MSDNVSILAQFKFTDDQRQAVTSRKRSIAVTAGAGSGKTRVLVGRYLHLLEKGYPLRSLVAITFTEKAAREMRSRIRAALELRAAAAANFDDTPKDGYFVDLLAQLDAARISTIHSLCAEILRAHPVEAGLDPNFTVLEEGRAAALQAQSVEETLAWAAGQPDLATLFATLRDAERGLRTLLTTLIKRRLDAAALRETTIDDRLAYLERWLDETLRVRADAWLNALDALNQVSARQSDDKLEQARRAVLNQWQAVRDGRQARDWDFVFTALVQLRGAIDVRGGQKANWNGNDLNAAREAMKGLRDFCDAELSAVIDKGSPVRWSCDQQAAALLPALQRALAYTLDDYQRLKDELQALDFDDLEGRATQLLKTHDEVRARWQAELRAVLVDEFQDTNQRQRDLIYALTGFDLAERAQGELFVVGDAKQSIYRFRGADVAVFRQVQSNIAEAKGLSVDLDVTFRAHQALLDTTNALLAPILGEISDARQPYQIPFAPLKAHRRKPQSKSARDPFVELQLGLGEDADQGRAAAASALVTRLQQLHADEGFAWQDIALLFRSSTHFEAYEDALERQGVPFVTVAGRGFYDHPEIRDVLNALAAIADPTDDLALAGLLRSPALSLSDVDLYCLRFDDHQHSRALWTALQELAAQPERDDAARAVNIVTELHDLAGRVNVAEVIKRFFDLTAYRALLSAAPGGTRLRRNVDKLLADAHRSRLVSLSEFLDYVQTLRDVGAREGEAPVEAEGAVQLMTIHKAKGLEFPVVVIADAASEHHGGSDSVLLDEQLGLLIDLVEADGARPVLWRLGQLNEIAKADAEDKRLLYVALTRAREKLIISGHVKRTTKGLLSLHGWLKDLGAVIGLDQVELAAGIDRAGALTPHAPLELPHPIGCMLSPVTGLGTATAASPVDDLPVSPMTMPDLARPLPVALPEPSPAVQNLQSKVWRVVPRAKRPSGPAWVVGRLVHEALQRWRFPSEENFDVFLWPFALELGLIDQAEIQATIDEARRLLRRFQAHPLCQEIAAAERYHEVPYAVPGDKGVIDLLYRSGSTWTIVDFKTDEVRSIAEMRETIQREKYAEQVQRYIEATTLQIGQRPRGRLVFLHVRNTIQVEDL